MGSPMDDSTIDADAADKMTNALDVLTEYAIKQ